MHHHKLQRERFGFTLIELLVVIAIIAILSIVVILTLNPAELLRQSRDSSRVSDMATLAQAANLYITDRTGSSLFSLGSSTFVYTSAPDPAAVAPAGSNCSGLGLPTLTGGYTYHCVGTGYSHNVDGTGWIPVNLNLISSGSPISLLPVDPTNVVSTALYYTYTTNGTQFEVTAVMESQKFKAGGTGDVITNDGAAYANTYAKGTNLALEPLDYGTPSIAFIQMATSSKWAGSNLATATDTFVTQNVTGGDLIAGVVVWKTDTLNSVTDSCGNSYTIAANTTVANSYAMWGFYAKNVAGGSKCLVTATFSGSETGYGMVIDEISNANKTIPLDTTVTANQGGTGAGTDALTTSPFAIAYGGEYVFGVMDNPNANGAVISAGTNYTLRDFENSASFMAGSKSFTVEDRTVPTATSTIVSFTNGSFSNALILGMAFRP